MVMPSLYLYSGFWSWWSLAPGPPAKNSILIMSIYVERKCIELTDDLMLHSHDPPILCGYTGRWPGFACRFEVSVIEFIWSYHHVLRLDGTRPINWYILIWTMHVSLMFWYYVLLFRKYRTKQVKLSLIFSDIARRFYAQRVATFGIHVLRFHKFQRTIQLCSGTDNRCSLLSMSYSQIVCSNPIVILRHMISKYEYLRLVRIHWKLSQALVSKRKFPSNRSCAIIQTIRNVRAAFIGWKVSAKKSVKIHIVWHAIRIYKATVVFIFSLTGDFEEKWSRGDEIKIKIKQKNLYSRYTIFFKVRQSQKKIFLIFTFFVDYSSVLSF